MAPPKCAWMCQNGHLQDWVFAVAQRLWWASTMPHPCQCPQCPALTLTLTGALTQTLILTWALTHILYLTLFLGSGLRSGFGLGPNNLFLGPKYKISRERQPFACILFSSSTYLCCV